MRLRLLFVLAQAAATAGLLASEGALAARAPPPLLRGRPLLAAARPAAAPPRSDSAALLQLRGGGLGCAVGPLTAKKMLWVNVLAAALYIGSLIGLDPMLPDPTLKYWQQPQTLATKSILQFFSLAILWTNGFMVYAMESLKVDPAALLKFQTWGWISCLALNFWQTSRYGFVAQVRAAATRVPGCPQQPAFSRPWKAHPRRICPSPRAARHARHTVHARGVLGVPGLLLKHISRQGVNHGTRMNELLYESSREALGVVALGVGCMDSCPRGVARRETCSVQIQPVRSTHKKLYLILHICLCTRARCALHNRCLQPSR